MRALFYTAFVLKALALGWSFYLIYRHRNWRIAAVSAIVATMLLIHALLWLGAWDYFAIGSYWGEGLRFALALLVLAGVLYLGRMLRIHTAVEAKLRQNEYNLARAQEIARVGSWTWDFQTNQFSWSNRLLEIFGLDASRFDGRLGSVLMLIHPDDRETIMEAFRGLPHKTAAFPIQYRIVKPQGVERHIWSEVTVLRDAQARPTKAIGTVQDITERVRAEQGLRDSRTRLKLLNALAGHILAGKSIEDMITLVLLDLSPAFAPLRAFYGRCDASGRIDFVPPGEGYPSRLADCRSLDLAAAPQARQALLERRLLVVDDVAHSAPLRPLAADLLDAEVRALVCAATYYSPDETGILGLESSKPRTWSEHEIATLSELGEYLSGAIRDARAEAQRQRAEAALRASEERFQTVLRSVNDIVWATTPDESRFLYLNDAAERVFGLSSQSFYARPEYWRELIHPDDVANYDRNSRELMRRGETQLEYRIIRPDGQVRWVHTKRNLRTDDDGRPARIAGVTTDMTEHRRLEEEMQQARRLESMAAMAAGFAHDVNNLVMAVLSNASLALAELPESTPARDTLLRLEIDADRAARLCAQLLAYSGEGKFSLERIELNAFVRDLMPLIETGDPGAIQPRLILTHGVPPIEADRTQLQQAVMNLLANAREALRDSSGRLSIATYPARTDTLTQDAFCFGATLPDGPCACLSVEDTGCGMDEETLSRAFDPFFSTKDPSRGLGLAAVLGIVRAHRGAVLVETEPTRGSKFTLVFPGVF